MHDCSKGYCGGRRDWGNDNTWRQVCCWTFLLDAHQYKEAWDIIYGEWLPGSGYQPDDRPCFEVYLNNPDEHPEKKSIVDMYIPVKPL